MCTYLRQLIGFLIKASSDHRMGPHHVSIYMALFCRWCAVQENPFTITQNDISQAAKVGRTTYHKCMKELHDYGYIEYTPSYNPALGSMVYFVECEI